MQKTLQTKELETETMLDEMLKVKEMQAIFSFLESEKKLNGVQNRKIVKQKIIKVH